MRLLKYIIPALCGVVACASAQAKSYRLLSPDKKNEVTVKTDGGLSYSVERNGNPLIAPSALRMTVGGAEWGADGNPSITLKGSVDETVRFAVARKYPETQNRYNYLTLRYKDYDVEFRAYDDGVAYRFVGKNPAVSTVDGERVEFNFTGDPVAFTLMTPELQGWYEENYTVAPLSEQPRDKISIIPVMVEAGGCKVLLAEANLYDYSGIYLKVEGNGFRGVHANYPAKEEFFDGTNKIYATGREDYIVECSMQRTFPWRVAGIFDREVDILSSELIYMLSDESSGDNSWIKPGKVLWDWWNNRNIYGVDFVSGINTDTYIYLVDYAARHGFEYILIDEGWTERDDMLALNPEVDMPRICAHAAAKGVGVMLWAKWINVDRQLDEAFDMMAAWGVKGVKIDFMDRNDAKMVNFYERVARKGHEKRMLIDFHGSYPNEGMRRRYPALMTREGVVGLEYNKWSDRATPAHDVMISYLRMWAGPMDYTPGAMLNSQPETFFITQLEPMSRGTRAHQLAMYVVYESPLQMLSDSPSKYDENPESLRFLKAVPTVWDETVPLSGDIRRNVAVARRSGETWFVGVLGGTDAQEIDIDLSLLGDGEYVMEEWRDGVNAGVNGKDCKHTRTEVRGGDKISVQLARGGGYAAIFTPKIK